MPITSDASFPDWVNEAARMPIAFAQVREDALLDLAIVQRIGRPDLRVMMIASGGCTAAALAACGQVRHLHLVDINPAQLALTRLKLHLLTAASPIERQQLLGHAKLPPEQRAARLATACDAIQLSPDALGQRARLAEVGPDHAGRYELLFAQLRMEMRGLADEWFGVLTADDQSTQSAKAAADSELGRALDAAFDRVMALPNLVRLFSADATQNSVEAFSRHFARRTRIALAMPPATENPYLWQVLLGRFPQGVAYPWIDSPTPPRMPEIVETLGSMAAALSRFRDSFDYVHLSNILDWLAPDDARRILENVHRALRPGGFTLIRQLNSSLDIPSLGERFEWLRDEAAALHRRDRSYFYRSLHLGRKR